MYKKALLFYISLLSLSLIFSGCCEFFYTVTSDFQVSFTNYNQATTIDPATDTIREAFIYSMDAVIVADNSAPADLSIFNSAYALSCSDTYLNPYVRETATLTLDKSFYHNGHNIMPGTNLLMLEEDFEVEGLNAGAYEYSLRVWFHQNFIDLAWFPVDTYTFTASVQMEDGTIVTSTDAIVIDIPY
jgi:hypothetical protein